jgi:hypothetical protein
MRLVSRPRDNSSSTWVAGLASLSRPGDPAARQPAPAATVRRSRHRPGRLVTTGARWRSSHRLGPAMPVSINPERLSITAGDRAGAAAIELSEASMRNSAASRSSMTPGSSGGPSRWASSAGVGVSASGIGNPAARGCSNSTVSPCRFAITRPRLLARWMTPGANCRPAAAVTGSLTVPLRTPPCPIADAATTALCGVSGVLAGVSAGKHPRYRYLVDRPVVDPACLAAELTKHPDHPPPPVARRRPIRPG